MIIRRMTANYGVLQNRTLELQPGLNVIEAPNENGKSTWCSFLRAMFYGIDTSQRGKNGHMPDKLLYSPWNGSPMAGTVDLEWQDKHITLRRETRRGGAPMRDFSAVYTGTSKIIGGINGTDAGEILLGASQPVFERTAFIGSAFMSVAQGPELEKRIGSLLSAGEEEQSFSDASSRLRQWQRKCRYRSQGRLPELEAEQKKLEDSISAIELTASRLDQAETMWEKAHLLSEALRQDERQTDLSLREELSALEAQRHQLEEEADALTQAANAAFAEFERAPDEEMRGEVLAAEKRGRFLQKETQHSVPGTWLWLLPFAAGLCCVSLGLWEKILLALGGGLLALSVCFLVLRLTRLRRIRRAEASLASLLDEYGVNTPEEVLQGFTELENRWQEAEELEQRAETLREKSKQAVLRSNELYRKIQAENTADTSSAMKKALEEEQNYRETALRLRGRLDTMEDVVVLRSRLTEVKREHDRLERKYEALCLALDELAEADEEMQSVFAPQLSREAAEIFSCLTGGRYTDLALDRELAAMVTGKGEIIPHGGEYLSRGTSDQMYLALRLALCKLVLGGDEPCPLILDDALINFDDERMGYALDYLKELAEERQIILFTCHSREKRYLNP